MSCGPVLLSRYAHLTNRQRVPRSACTVQHIIPLSDALLPPTRYGPYFSSQGDTHEIKTLDGFCLPCVLLSTCTDISGNNKIATGGKCQGSLGTNNRGGNNFLDILTILQIVRNHVSVLFSLQYRCLGIKYFSGNANPHGKNNFQLK